ncbi:DUF7576 family protein [Haloarchaeobius amylolyticus]|uniref:DUF7576 family protein n=1 Tax=Haloarchaeobius amylolyticus TaxID=1198296 RepID=UPI003F5E7A83
MQQTDATTAESQQQAANACAVCGDPVATTEWHPATTETTPDGDVVIVSFCGQTCRDHWVEAD